MRQAPAAFHLAVLVLFAAGHSACALDSAKPPGRNFDLSHWKLQLPIDSSGGTNGNAAEASVPQLVAGYTNPPYFYTGPDGAMVFWCPCAGATTSGSTHPRTELRELLVTNDTRADWNAEGRHAISAQCQVNAVAAGGKVCIGQVHGYNTNIPLVMVYFDNSQNPGTVTATVKYHADASPVGGHQDKTLTFANVGFNTAINYQILVTNGMAVITVNGSTQLQDFYAADPGWTNVNYYFKAGNYYTANGGTTNAAQVSFYAVTTGHAPLITSQPASLAVLAGSNASFTVAASGNKPLAYQWYLNATNTLARATNASLTITNAQATNAGSYTVLVTDRWGAVTSSVAVLTVGPVPNVPSRVLWLVPAGQKTTVAFSGMPAQGYGVRRSTNLADWVLLLTTNAPGDGLFRIEDTFSDLGRLPPRAFYQLAAPVP